MDSSLSNLFELRSWKARLLPFLYARHFGRAREFWNIYTRHWFMSAVVSCASRLLVRIQPSWLNELMNSAVAELHAGTISPACHRGLCSRGVWSRANRFSAGRNLSLRSFFLTRLFRTYRMVRRNRRWLPLWREIVRLCRLEFPRALWLAVCVLLFLATGLNGASGFSVDRFVNNSAWDSRSLRWRVGLIHLCWPLFSLLTALLKSGWPARAVYGRRRNQIPPTDGTY